MSDPGRTLWFTGAEMFCPECLHSKVTILRIYTNGDQEFVYCDKCEKKWDVTDSTEIKEL